MRPALFFTVAALVAGCSSQPPKPPEADETRRRPANNATAVELQVCQGNLQNTRIVASEARREAQAVRAYAALAAAQSAAQATTSGVAAPSAHEPNAVHVLLFGYGSSRLDLPADAQRITEAARAAPLVVLRGRTDGAKDAVAEGRVARERTAAVQAWLVRAGVDPSRIRATWQPVGDFAADNTVEAGRALNRRVEIEIYRNAPRFIAAGSPASP
ncbi:hypothetical protein CKO44_00255 [Rubrivivax gelatinosus]|uniref:OmpA family protein n=1 Tax=Rubrivivax gelatinosus TaxID=28068 RepID=UPI001903DB8F|nr:OmpA family protein [Rubrivivax gelatinosus]MBK1611901.1 hypothetical protein [Rubrivivax gelatinosus]